MRLNYVGNDIDSSPNIPDENKCQRLCQEHVRCKFWSYDFSTKKCYRHTEASKALGSCNTCTHGPKKCSGKYELKKHF